MYMYNFLGQLFIIQYELGPTYLLKQINPWFKLDDVNQKYSYTQHNFPTDIQS